MTARLATHPDVSDRATSVVDRLVAAGMDVELVGEGDPGAPDDVRSRDPLAAVRDGSVDLALVGMRALRGSAADDLTTVAVLPRREPRDVLVSVSGRATTLVDLPRGSRVGLSGSRRRAFLAAHRPDAVPVIVERPRLAWLLPDDDLGVDAVIVSALDARAAGLADRSVEALDTKAWLPEPGQGALALVARHPIAEATAMDHLPTRTALRSELALLEAVGASDDVALGCLAQPSGRWIRLWAAAASEDGRRLVRSDLTGPLDEPEGLGAAVAKQLVERGFGLVLQGATP